MTKAILLCSAVVLVAASGMAAAYPDDPRIDATTGRDVSNYPPPRHFDLIHMKLGIDIPEMSHPFFNGVETLTISPIGTERSSLVLNCKGPKVDSVAVAGKGAAASQQVAFVQDDKFLTITFQRPVKLGE